MVKKATPGKPAAKRKAVAVPPSAGMQSSPPAGRPSALPDTRIVYCGDNLEQLAELPDKCVDLIYIDYMLPPQQLRNINPATGALPSELFISRPSI